MKTPLTPLERVFAVLQLDPNILSELAKSAQQLIDNLHENLIPFYERLAKGMAEYERVESEAFEVLKSGGLLGMGHQLTGPPERTILAIPKTKRARAASCAIRG